ncbi:MAG: hypothetical protein DI551_04340 [Micavibrio aeruginosavorus]|uniref:Uncharacterized protein n=1 Tax=Micavibrio aeruginosavorus TaxID=349221 RepID=A0A2W5N841_9BACT|nr:MAG: hypothetical protein DI551_04340 [Micavibrio aeruginosavorus]
MPQDNDDNDNKGTGVGGLVMNALETAWKFSPAGLLHTVGKTTAEHLVEDAKNGDVVKGFWDASVPGMIYNAASELMGSITNPQTDIDLSKGFDSVAARGAAPLPITGITMDQDGTFNFPDAQGAQPLPAKFEKSDKPAVQLYRGPGGGTP